VRSSGSPAVRRTSRVEPSSKGKMLKAGENSEVFPSLSVSVAVSCRKGASAAEKEKPSSTTMANPIGVSPSVPGSLKNSTVLPLGVPAGTDPSIVNPSAVSIVGGRISAFPKLVRLIPWLEPVMHLYQSEPTGGAKQQTNESEPVVLLRKRRTTERTNHVDTGPIVGNREIFL
jgi:hypothetical protein